MGKFEIFLLLLGVGLLAFFSQMPNSSTGGAYPEAPQRSEVRGPGLARGLGEFEGVPILARFSAASFKVVDGDSIRILTADAGEVDLRLASIDAPEWNQTGGRAAKKHLEALTSGRTATFFQTGTDRYQRPVVFMFVDGLKSGAVSGEQLEVNAQMVADGFAWHAIKFSSSERLAQLEASARSERLGLWAASDPQSPWEYRDRE